MTTTIVVIVGQAAFSLSTDNDRNMVHGPLSFVLSTDNDRNEWSTDHLVRILVYGQ